MARAHPRPIPPFPPEIDRQYFAPWFSGFCDGEATFVLGRSRRTRQPGSYQYTAFFSITLRADDRDILQRVQSFLDCGMIYHRANSHDKVARKILNAHPGAQFSVYRTADIRGRLVPHFHAYPLLAKKARDFSIWERGVEVLHRVAQRKRHGRTGPTGRTGPGGAGCFPMWQDADIKEFMALRAALKAQRFYNAPAVELPAPRPPAPEPPGLFDGLP